MAFSKRQWANRERLTAADFNGLEDRVAEGIRTIPIEISDPVVAALVADQHSETATAMDSAVDAAVDRAIEDGRITGGGGGGGSVVEVQPGVYEFSGTTVTEVQPGVYEIGA